MIEKILIKYGLSSKEVKVYLALLTVGTSVVSDIAKQANINRSTTYVLLESLTERGLVNTSEKNKVKQYSPTPPSGLTHSLEETISSNKQLLKDLQNVLPELETFYNKKGGKQVDKPLINFYEGIGGLKSIYDSAVHADSNLFIFNSSQDKHEILEKYFHSFYSRLRKRNRPIKIITADDNEHKLLSGLSHVTVLKKPSAPSVDMEIVIFNNHVAFISLKKRFGYVFENESLAKICTLLFNHTWNDLEHTTATSCENLKKATFTNKSSRSNSVYLLDESKNEFGTIKDRRNLEISKRAKLFAVDKVVLVTSGSDGVSLSQYLKGSGIKLVCIVDKKAPAKVKSDLAKRIHQLIEINMSSRKLKTEDIITLARESDEEIIWDVTTGYEEVYGRLIENITKTIIPDYVIVPVGSGEIFVGMAHAIERLNLKTIIVGVRPKESRSVIADKLSLRYSSYPKLLRRLTQSQHKILDVSENEIRKLYEEYHYVCDSEPSSTVVFFAFKKYVFKKNETVVLVNYGRSL